MKAKSKYINTSMILNNFPKYLSFTVMIAIVVAITMIALASRRRIWLLVCILLILSFLFLLSLLMMLPPITQSHFCSSTNIMSNSVISNHCPLIRLTKSLIPFITSLYACSAFDILVYLLWTDQFVYKFSMII